MTRKDENSDEFEANNKGEQKMHLGRFSSHYYVYWLNSSQEGCTGFSFLGGSLVGKFPTHSSNVSQDCYVLPHSMYLKNC